MVEPVETSTVHVVEPVETTTVQVVEPLETTTVHVVEPVETTTVHVVKLVETSTVQVVELVETTAVPVGPYVLPVVEPVETTSRASMTPESRTNAPVVAVVGPTAAGKSELAVELALRLGGEVVNGDSMQLYRGMDIGTAKLPPAGRRGVPHHLLDVLDVTEPATVAEFQALARAAIEECRSRRAVPVLVGGSALYMRAVLDRFEFPGTDSAIRARLEAELAVEGAQVMHRRLHDVDPVAAAAILPTNGRRVVRALEVVEITGRPFLATLPRPQYVFDRVVQIGVHVPRGHLDARIEARVDRMWAAGFVDEVRRLEAAGLRRGRTASRALGYRQVLRLLTGECSEEEAREDTVKGTRRFARRQDTWFRRDDRIEWLPYDASDLQAQALDAVRSAG